MKPANGQAVKISVWNPHSIEIETWPFRYFCPSKSCKGARRLFDVESQTCNCPAGRCKRPCHHAKKVNALFLRISRQFFAHLTNGGEASWTLLRQIEGMIEFRK